MALVVFEGNAVFHGSDARLTTTQLPIYGAVLWRADQTAYFEGQLVLLSHRASLGLKKL